MESRQGRNNSSTNSNGRTSNAIHFRLSDFFTQMEFPVSDVVTNFRQFLTSVKKATGNLKEADEAERRAKNSGGGRPGMFWVAMIFTFSLASKSYP